MTLPRPDEVRAAVAGALLSNSDLLDLLALNTPWNRPDNSEAVEHSIAPMFAIENLKPPFVGIMAGPMPKNEMVSYSSFMYIRVYDSADTDFIRIDEIAYQIAKSLHRAELTMANTVSTQVDFEQLNPEATDDALNLHYRELQFKLVVL